MHFSLSFSTDRMGNFPRKIKVVRAAGVEPARGFPQGILSPFYTIFLSHCSRSL
jgi:hypothetical protein